ncbi:MAG: DUF4115 domain-containing protein [Alicyclobacillus sp.]|nr:DUF4115 domain-containing protein [Alicyclobacillus sp.]
MRELGQELRQRREALGMDLDELQAKTKIRKRYLIALEEGAWDELPGEVYARGFVRSYAACVGLDGQALLDRFLATSGPRPASGEKPEVQKDKADQVAGHGANTVGKAASVPLGLSHLSGTDRRDQSGVHRSRRRPSHRALSRGGSRGLIGQATAVVGILAVLGVGLWALHRGGSPSGQSSLGGSNVTGVHARQGGQKRTTSGQSTRHGAPANNTVAGSGNNLTNGNAATATNGVNTTNGISGNNQLGGNTASGQTGPGVTIVSAPTVNGSQVTYSVQTTGALSVSLHASSRLWTMVTADGSVVDGAGGEIIPPGQSKTFTASKSITFVIGNIPAASFSVNGQAVALPPLNRVIHVTFNRVSPGAGSTAGSTGQTG